MAKKDQAVEANVPETTVGVEALAKALTAAIEATQPPRKKTVITRKKATPWTPKDGSAKLKLKRRMYHHGLELTTKVSNEEIELLNKVKPGIYCDGWVKVTRRRDKGVDITYPIRTAAQRLKLLNEFGVRSFEELLKRIVDEQNNPKQYTPPEDLD